MRGKFITIYGINNIGKTTQAKLLVEKLTNAGYQAVYVKYPVYDIAPSGPLLNKVLRGAGGGAGSDAGGGAGSDAGGSAGSGQQIPEDELQLWFVINRYQFEPELKKLLKEGYIVIAEDYSGTGIAWGAAKGLKQRWLEEINQHLLKEDLAILLIGKRDLRAQEKNHMHEQNDKLISHCIKVHLQLGRKYGWKIVRVQPKIEETKELIWKVVKKFLDTRK